MRPQAHVKYYKGTLTDTLAYANKQFDTNVVFINLDWSIEALMQAREAALENNGFVSPEFEKRLEGHQTTVILQSFNGGMSVEEVVESIYAFGHEYCMKRLVVFTDHLKLAEILEAGYIPSSYLRG
ncbi:hypothetical protein D3C85_552940 [compost metagenome]